MPEAARAADTAATEQIAGSAGPASTHGAGKPDGVGKAAGEEAGIPDQASAAGKAEFAALVAETPPPAHFAPEAARAATHASGIAAAVPERAASAPSVPLGQVPMTIGLRSLAGSSEFQIRLDPLELGRIDVTLDIDKDRGTVTTHLVVERVETLAMLQRDAGSLQQALAQAGLDPEGGISLSLRSDGGGNAGQDERPGRGAPPGSPAQPAQPASVAEAVPMRALRPLSGLDIRI